jgi:uncharacterized membrane protein (DUF2068 family)
VAAFKLFEGLVVFAAAVGAVRLLHKGAAFEFDRWTNIFRVDPNNRYMLRLLEKLSLLDARKLRDFSVATFIYAGLLLAEGTGLLMGRGWAKYFTIIATSVFIPLEVYELARRLNWERLVVFLLNVVIVVYLVIELRRSRTSR